MLLKAITRPGDKLHHDRAVIKPECRQFTAQPNLSPVSFSIYFFHLICKELSTQVIASSKGKKLRSIDSFLLSLASFQSHSFLK